ncbi:phosphotransferase [Arthrobacter sp. Sa2CUA1]|uniref:Phosphotransferase n=1 Tax=Arthrobacter gallicola TaxID=2762225 RepID=A0ABR8URR0_9MICC|nr:phosphotransferase [Arthrobacter gallicola]MBD7995245.1 phosphotransferase [Arthrobacter gallicola]
MAAPLAQLLTPRHLLLDSWTHERTFHRPGAGISCLYRVRALDRQAHIVTLYAGATSTAVKQSAPDTVQTTLAGIRLSLWLHPRDPLLPSLPWALSPVDVARDVFGEPDAGDRTVLSLSAYRPLRRAVVRAVSAERTAYLKILLPGQSGALRHRHGLLAGTAVPAATVTGPDPSAGPRAEGAVVLSALTGEPLLHGLRSGTHGLVPQDLTTLLDQLPDGALALDRRPAWSERSRAYGTAAAAILPQETARISAAARTIETLVRGLDPGPVVPVHGDFYEGNLLTGGGRITGLLDVDGLGPGHRVDDLACFLGHLAVLTELAPESALPGELRVFHNAFEEFALASGSSPAALNARAAGVALSLVPGARAGRYSRSENALTRLRAAESLLARAVASNGGKRL